MRENSDAILFGFNAVILSGNYTVNKFHYQQLYCCMATRYCKVFYSCSKLTVLLGWIFSHTSCMSVALAVLLSCLLVRWWVHRFCPQLLNVLAWNSVQTVMVTRGWILQTLVTPCCSSSNKYWMDCWDGLAGTLGMHGSQRMKAQDFIDLLVPLCALCLWFWVKYLDSY